MSPIRSRTSTLQDSDLREFHTLPELAHRIPELPWQVEYVTLSTEALRCPYPNPGGAHAPPAGFMGGIGWPPEKAAGARIVDLASAIITSLSAGRADRSNKALDRVLTFYEGGVDFIRGRPQLMAFVHVNGLWWVREGMHRSVAMAMLGATELEAMNLSTLRQAAA